MKKRIIYAVAIILGIAILVFGIIFIVKVSNDNKGKFSAEMLEQNLKKDEEDPIYGVMHYDSLTKTIDKSDLVTDAYLPYGLVVYRTYSGIEFYSLQFNKTILTLNSNSYYSNYEVIPANGFGYFIMTNINYNYLLYDFYGNIIYDSMNEIEDIETKVSEDKAYVIITTKNSEEQGYVYSSVKSKPQYMNPDDIRDLNLSDEDDTPVFNQGDRYVDLDRFELSDYGFEDYYLSMSYIRNSNGSNYYIYHITDKNGENVSSFCVPRDPEGSVIVDECYYYQMKYRLPNEAEDYTFISDGQKYYLETIKINMFNGKQSNVKLDYVFDAGKPAKNKKGDYTIAIASIQEITDAKTLAPTKTVILNSKLEIIDDITKEGFNFVKVGNNFYNLGTQLLYDSSLNVISYLGAIDPIVNEESGVFVGKKDGAYGILSSNAKITIPFEYNYINSNIYNNYTIAQKGDLNYIIDVKNGIANSVICDSLEYLANGLLVKKSDSTISFLDETGNVKYTYNDYTAQNGHSYQTRFNDAYYYFASVSYDYYASSKIVFHSFVLNPYK